MAVENPCDIGVAQIISPVSAEGLGQESITVRIKNYADIPVDGFDVCYTVNGGEPVTEHVGETLAGNAEMEYTFSTPADFSTPSERYVITAYTLSSGDIADTNDSASATVVHMAPATVPYSRTGAGFLAYNYNKENDGDDWVDYSAVMTVASASEYSTTYGIPLADYAGKEVFVAIHQKTNDGVALILDNLGLYGNFTSIRSGVEQTGVDREALGVSRDGGMLRISGEFSRGAIYTAGGVKVMDITTPTADISSLGHGLYIINIDGRGIKLAL